MTPQYAAPTLPHKFTDALMAELLALDWLSVAAARREYFMSDVTRRYAYKTHDGPREYESRPYTLRAAGVLSALNVLLDARFNVCFLNRYDGQQDHLGWHADDSPEMDHDHPIAVVSLGAEREIWWRPKAEKGETPPERRRKLEHGSVFIMPPGFQREYVHRIPKADREVGTRISLTFRRFIDPPAAKPPAEEPGVYGKVPRRWRKKIGPDEEIKTHPNASGAGYYYGCYFPQTDLVIGEMGGRGTGMPEQVEWLDQPADAWAPANGDIHVKAGQ